MVKLGMVVALLHKTHINGVDLGVSRQFLLSKSGHMSWWLPLLKDISGTKKLSFLNKYPKSIHWGVDKAALYSDLLGGLDDVCWGNIQSKKLESTNHHVFPSINIISPYIPSLIKLYHILVHHVPSCSIISRISSSLFTCFPTCFPTCPNGVSHVENQRPGSHGRCALQLGAGEEAEAPRHVETLHRAFEDLPNLFQAVDQSVDVMGLSWVMWWGNGRIVTFMGFPCRKMMKNVYPVHQQPCPGGRRHAGLVTLWGCLKALKGDHGV